MADTIEILKLRQANSYSYRLSIPPSYVRTHKLTDGAQVYWIPEADGVRLKFLPLTPPGEGQSA